MNKSIEDVFKLAKEGKLYAGNLIDGNPRSEAKIDNYTPIDNTLIGHLEGFCRCYF